MSGKKFEGGELGEGQGSSKFSSMAESATERALRERKELNEKPVTEEEAREIFGDNFFGSQEVREAFDPFPYDQPPIPFSRSELYEAQQHGATLLLQCENYRLNPGDKFPQHKPLTLDSIIDLRRTKNGDFLTWEIPSHLRNTTEVPRAGWKLIFNHRVGGEMDIIGQMEVLMNEIENLLYAPEELPSEYKEASAELTAERNVIRTPLLWGGEYINRIKKLKATELLLEPAVELAYHMLLVQKTRTTPFSLGGPIRTSTDRGEEWIECSSTRDHFKCGARDVKAKRKSLKVRVTRMG